MMFDKAHVGSITVLDEFHAALAKFAHDAKQALITLDLEIRRAVDWIRIDRAQHWANEVRRSYEAVARAKDDLHRCITFKSTEHFTPSCIDEKKALQRAQERLRTAEEKVEAVKRWSRQLQHELNEYIGRLTQFHAVLDGDVPDAMALLGRMQQSLERYVTTTAPGGMSPDSLARTDSIVSPPGGEAVASMARPDEGAETRAQSPGESGESPEARNSAVAATQENTADCQLSTADLPSTTVQEVKP